MSTKSELKENILASKLEGVLAWGLQNRNIVFTAIGIFIAGVLISSVFVLRNKELRTLNYTRLAQAQAMIGQQRFDQANQILSELASSSMDDIFSVSVSYYRGLSALGSKNFEQAAHFFQEAVDKPGHTPLKPLALSNLAHSFEQKKDYASAAAVYARFMTEFGDHFLAPRMQLSLGKSLFISGKTDEAKKALNQLIDLYPTSAWAENARSFLDKNKSR